MIRQNENQILDFDSIKHNTQQEKRNMLADNIYTSSTYFFHILGQYLGNRQLERIATQ